jgi:hypothetical protein
MTNPPDIWKPKPVRAQEFEEFERSHKFNGRLSAQVKGQERVEIDRLEDAMHLPAAEAHDLGRLSAEAVLKQYETAAHNVEEMGAAVKERIAALTAALAECDADMRLIGEAANAIREKGKHAYAHIEHTAAVSREIRAICSEFQRKAATP